MSISSAPPGKIQADTLKQATTFPYSSLHIILKPLIAFNLCNWYNIVNLPTNQSIKRYLKTVNISMTNNADSFSTSSSWKGTGPRHKEW